MLSGEEIPQHIYSCVHIYSLLSTMDSISIFVLLLFFFTLFIFWCFFSPSKLLLSFFAASSSLLFWVETLAQCRLKPSVLDVAEKDRVMTGWRWRGGHTVETFEKSERGKEKKRNLKAHRRVGDWTARKWCSATRIFMSHHLHFLFPLPRTVITV